MAKEQYFVASNDLFLEVVSTWRAANATLVSETSTGQLESLLAIPEREIAENSILRFFVYDLPFDLIKLRLETVRAERGELRTFVQQRYGSPYIDVSWIKARQIGEGVVAGHGNFALYPHYYDIDTNEKVRPSESLKELFRSAVSLVSKRSKIGRSPIVPKTFLVEKALYERGSGHWFDYRVS
ncbi:MAG TPA: hypothetical protein VFZ35_08840 [Sphingomicrobium sp.]